jgi:pilus assembly protein CpaF
LINEEIVQQLREEIRDKLDLSSSTSNEVLFEQIEESVFRFSKSTFLSAQQKKGYVERIFNSFRGLDVSQRSSGT